MKAIEIENLEKTYKKGTQALKGVSLSVEEGDFFALLGPNGAGKSTTINILSSLVTKTSGSVKIFGKDLEKNQNEIKMMIGLVPQEFNFNIFENVEDIIINQAGYFGIPKKVAAERAEKYLKQLGLWEKRNAVSRTLSGGMKRKLMIVRGLIHEPKLLILDEPTAGVDVETRRDMWNFIQELNKNGVTVILTTHYLEEAEQLCKNIAIINKGEVVKNTSMKELLTNMNTEVFVFDVQQPIRELPLFEEVNASLIDEMTLSIDIPKESSLNAVFETLQKNNINVVSMRNKSNRLEELFINLTKND